MDTASANQDRLSFFGIDSKDYKSFPRILKLLQKHAPEALALGSQQRAGIVP